MAIDHYVTALRTRLPFASCHAAEVTEEVQGHLEDAARDLQMAGLSPYESEREAIRRFGTPDEISGALIRAERAWRQSRASARGLLAATLAAAALAALGAGAVAAAHTPSAPAGLHRSTTAVARGGAVAHTFGPIRGGH